MKHFWGILVAIIIAREADLRQTVWFREAKPNCLGHAFFAVKIAVSNTMKRVLRRISGVDSRRPGAPFVRNSRCINKEKLVIFVLFSVEFG